jgi:hypothetical protein
MYICICLSLLYTIIFVFVGMKSVSREFAAESFEDMGLWISELQDAIERCQMKVYICLYV